MSNASNNGSNVSNVMVGKVNIMSNISNITQGKKKLAYLITVHIFFQTDEKVKNEYIDHVRVEGESESVENNSYRTGMTAMYMGDYHKQA